MSSAKPKIDNRPSLPWLYIVGCLLILAGVATPLWRWSTPAKAEAAVAPINASPWRLQNIEAIRVGQRVVTDSANRTETLPTAVDPATWRRVTIVGTREMASGKEDRIVVQTIVPPTWLEFFDAHVGAVVPYPLDLVEMGIPEELDGEITDIAPCPAILEGPGRVVLTTVHHLSHDVWQLELTAEDGTSEQLKSTGFHPFYSVDRDDYVQVHELRAGERLQGSQGLVTLQAKKPVAGYHEVYNLTVEEEHVYRVGGMGTLVHNTRCGLTEGEMLASKAAQGFDNFDCRQCARSIAKELDEAGVPYSRLYIEGKYSYEYYQDAPRLFNEVIDEGYVRLVSDRLARETGGDGFIGNWHEIVIVDRYVFDNHNPNGILLLEWLLDVHAEKGGLRVFDDAWRFGD